MTDKDLCESVTNLIAEWDATHSLSGDVQSAVRFEIGQALRNQARHSVDRIEALSAEVERLREDRDTALDALFDAIALIGHSMPMHTEALVGGERMVARDIWQKGHDIMFPRAALGPKP